MLSRISRRITTACLPSVSFSYSFRRFASSLPPSTVRPISASVTFLLKRGEKLTVDGTVEECLEQGKYVQRVIARGKHQQLIDERGLYGGLDVGPSPYDLLLAALGGCTSMTLRIYLDRKSLSHTVPPLRIDLLHAKKPASELVECPSTIPPRTLCDLFELTISSTNDAAVPHELRANLLEIAAKCPVHKTLAGNPTTFVRTRWKEDESMDSTTAHALGNSA